MGCFRMKKVDEQAQGRKEQENAQDADAAQPGAFSSLRKPMCHHIPDVLYKISCFNDSRVLFRSLFRHLLFSVPTCRILLFRKVLLSTSMRDFTIEIFAGKAPSTAGNFLAYVDDDFYGETTLSVASSRSEFADPAQLLTEPPAFCYEETMNGPKRRRYLLLPNGRCLSCCRADRSA